MDSLEKLKQDKSGLEQSLKIPQDVFARVIAEAQSRHQWRNRIEGLLLGLVTGFASSYLVAQMVS